MPTIGLMTLEYANNPAEAISPDSCYPTKADQADREVLTEEG